MHITASMIVQDLSVGVEVISMGKRVLFANKI